MLQTRETSILDISNGALAEEISVKLAELAQNIIDPNTDYKPPRKMVITLEFRSDPKRQIVSMNATTIIKPVASKPVTAQLFMGVDPSTGAIGATEITDQAPGQMDIDGGEQAPGKHIVFMPERKAQ